MLGAPSQFKSSYIKKIDVSIDIVNKMLYEENKDALSIAKLLIIPTKQLFI